MVLISLCHVLGLCHSKVVPCPLPSCFMCITLNFAVNLKQLFKNCLKKEIALYWIMGSSMSKWIGFITLMEYRTQFRIALVCIQVEEKACTVYSSLKNPSPVLSM